MGVGVIVLTLGHPSLVMRHAGRHAGRCHVSHVALKRTSPSIDLPPVSNSEDDDLLMPPLACSPLQPSPLPHALRNMRSFDFSGIPPNRPGAGEGRRGFRPLTYRRSTLPCVTVPAARPWHALASAPGQPCFIPCQRGAGNRRPIFESRLKIGRFKIQSRSPGFSRQDRKDRQVEQRSEPQWSVVSERPEWGTLVLRQLFHALRTMSYGTRCIP